MLQVCRCSCWMPCEFLGGITTWLNFFRDVIWKRLQDFGGGVDEHRTKSDVNQCVSIGETK